MKAIIILVLAVVSAHSYLRQRAEIRYFDSILRQPKCARAVNEESSLPRTCGKSYGGEDSYMSQVEELLQRQCDLIDPIRGQENNLNIAENQNVDFIVVGAGTAGSIVAGRLAEAPQNWQVALLEAGGPFPTGCMFPGSYFSYAKADSGFNWDFLLEPQQYACKGHPNGQCHWPRGKALGGTGVLHGMMYMRGNAWDYDSRWSKNGIEGWRWNDVLPYFMISENNTQVGPVYTKDFHSTTGPVVISQFRDHPRISEKILAAGGEMGYKYGNDLNGKSQLGFTLAQATHVDGSRLSMYNSYVAPLVASKKSNLIVSPWSYVTKILFSDDLKKAIGVEYIKNNATHRVYANKEVILAGGAIQSPQIMLLSGLGPKEDLQKLNIKVVQDMPRVGKNLQNHVSFSIKYKVNESQYEERLNDDSLYAYLTSRQGPLTSTGLSQTTAFVRVNNLDGTPDTVPQVQMFFEGYLANCSTDGQISNCGETRYITMTPTLLRPKSSGTITLRSSNPVDPPVIVANYLLDQEERDTMVDAIKFTLKLAQTKALKDVVSLVVPPTTLCTQEFGSDEYWHCAIQHWNNPENHQIGTCSMGTSIANSVVDPQLRVHGISGLRVVDAAIAPEQLSGNANAPIMMIAEKGADMIKKTYA